MLDMQLPAYWPIVLSRCFGDWSLMMLCVTWYSRAFVCVDSICLVLEMISE